MTDHRPGHQQLKMRPTLGLMVGAVAAFSALPALAGVPFRTDDPGTPPEGHFEINLSVQYGHNESEHAGFVPSLEINYGLLENLQVTLMTPLALSHTVGGTTNVGVGDLVLGAKYRLIEDDAEGWRPSVAFAPSMTLPSGDASRGLGAGRSTFSLPVWLGKGFDDVSVAVGASYNVNPGHENRNFWYAGGLVTYKLTPELTVGGELFHITPDAVDAKSSTGFNLGLLYDFTDNHHLLFSAGRNLVNATENNQFSTYIGYRLTF